jgi:hypothetical protein
VPRRPLVFVSALTVGDYLLWSWSLNGNHVVIALVAGLTLPPLALACLWLLALGLVRLIAGAARSRVPLAHARAARARRSAPGPGARAGRPATAEQARASDRASRKLAA